MTEQGPPPIFLERRSYRRRRMMDALRLLPVVGVLLWLLPMFWPKASDGPAAPAPLAMSDAIVYVFCVWVALIAGGAALWWALRPPNGDGPEDPAREDR